MPNWLTTKVMSLMGRAVEGQFRPGPYPLSTGWLPAGSGWNYWQTGLPQGGLPYGERSAMVEACVSAYAQTVAMCPGDHWRKLANGGRERVPGSALTRILKRPNDYQSMSDLLLHLTRRLYEQGQAFAVAIRNNRAEINELHLMRIGQGSERRVTVRFSTRKAIRSPSSATIWRCRCRPATCCMSGCTPAASAGSAKARSQGRRRSIWQCRVRR
jgi:hypothetical protein